MWWFKHGRKSVCVGSERKSTWTRDMRTGYTYYGSINRYNYSRKHSNTQKNTHSHNIYHNTTRIIMLINCNIDSNTLDTHTNTHTHTTYIYENSAKTIHLLYSIYALSLSLLCNLSLFLPATSASPPPPPPFPATSAFSANTENSSTQNCVIKPNARNTQQTRTSAKYTPREHRAYTRAARVYTTLYNQLGNRREHPRL